MYLLLSERKRNDAVELTLIRAFCLCLYKEIHIILISPRYYTYANILREITILRKK